MESLPKSKPFWDASVDQAIITFTTLEDGPERQQLYLSSIHPALVKLLKTFHGKYCIYYHLPEQSYFIDLLLPDLYLHLTQFKDRRTTNLSLYTYFFVLIKQQWLLHNRLQSDAYTLHAQPTSPVSLDALMADPYRQHTLPFFTPAYDSEIDLPILIKDICASISADIESQHRRTSTLSDFGQAIIDYLNHTNVDDIDIKDLRNQLKKAFPQYTRQTIHNLLRHYRQVIAKHSPSKDSS